MTIDKKYLKLAIKEGRYNKKRAQGDWETGYFVGYIAAMKTVLNKLDGEGK